MKKLAMAAVVALLAGMGIAHAADPLKADRDGIYGGLSVGSATADKSRVYIGGDAGFQLCPWFRAEVDYTHAWHTNGTGDMLMVNAMPQYRIPNSTVTPYAFAGAGLGFANLGALRNHDAQGLYDVGAGVRVAVSQSVELDARYTNVRAFDTKNSATPDQSLFMVGVNYRF